MSPSPTIFSSFPRTSIFHLPHHNNTSTSDSHTHSFLSTRDSLINLHLSSSDQTYSIIYSEQRTTMAQQMHRILMLSWTSLLLVVLVLSCGLSLRSVDGFSGGNKNHHHPHHRPSPQNRYSKHFRNQDAIDTGSSSKIVSSPSFIKQKQQRQQHCCCHKAKAGNDEDDDDYYYPDSTSRSPSTPRTSRRQKPLEDQYYEYYYEDEEESLPFPEPVRSNGEDQKLARYPSRQNALDDEDDDEEFYDDDEEDDGYDDGEDDEDSFSSGGNFWSNPTGGIDRSKRPPSPPSPRVTRPRRRSSEDSSYDSGSRRRRRSPVRSDGLNQAPMAAKDFYDRLFWYGFDPDDSEQVGDRTVFGGTKGKFNGLAFLQASESSPGRSIRSRQEQRQLPPTTSSSSSSSSSGRSRSRRDEYNDAEEDLFEEEDGYDDDDGFFDDADRPVSKSKTGGKSNITPPDDDPMTRRNERETRVQPPPRRRRRLPPREYDYDGEEEEEEDDVLINGGDWVSKQVSSWFKGNEEDEDYDDRSSRRQGRGRRQGPRRSAWSPFNVLNTFLGVDPDDMAYKADMYNAKMGIGPRSRSGQLPDSSSKRQQRRQARDNPGRPGYAYRYNAEDDTGDEDASFTVDIEPMVIEEGSLNGKQNGGEGRSNTNHGSEISEDVSRRGRELTWEERALAVERVPPAEIPGWGPSGELPIDGRTRAILDALEDIQAARQKVEAREKKEALAKEEITILKVDAELQRRQLEDSRANARRAQERLRQIELDIDGASRVLRRARSRVQLARDQLAELQARHWAVLGFYNPDQAEEKVAEALKEFRLSESTARPVDDLTTVGQPAASSQEDHSSATPPQTAQGIDDSTRSSSSSDLASSS